MNNSILKVDRLYMSFNGVCALANFAFELHRKEILGLIGPNGAGKTTLFNVITGFITPDKGKVSLKETNITGLAPFKVVELGISRTFQNLRLINQVSVLDNVLLFFRQQSGEKLSNVFFRRKNIRAQENVNREEALLVLDEVGLFQKANEFAENLSYGQQKLLSLACCMASKSDLLMLDEPVAGIAPELINKILGIIRELPSKGKSVILIEHNLDAVAQVCDRVLFMDAGVKVSEGTPEEIRNDPKVIDAYIG